ncbi:uncharacterized protein Z520_04889 [Fonsecaea multimorphosa CBS 102226]|uniref:Uncharacterized protein n=1 Tax=Fonsecaea multimorphosa CBS 102226 TaxID=1442371 RepID=A0A0D2KRH2_9EURO|nr:uncharacterized protein Z520_04889 [Fonsecaea multimorphosa CBS 102226]KIX99313.1 hypothetical protein Z520_04889 [Fonsecaea multimorphosa CBS 102226]OAL25644.1 hypothetical protein AYO22_04633 [Fonsecaea multimorphosa]
MASSNKNNNGTTTSNTTSLDQACSFPPLERPMSPPVPTTEGRRPHRPIPMREIDEDGIEDIQVPLIPAIGRIEDLIRYPAPPRPQPPPPTPIIRPVPDYGTTLIIEYDLEDATWPTEAVPWPSYDRASGSASALDERRMPVISVVPEEEDSRSEWPQQQSQQPQQQHLRRRPVPRPTPSLEPFPPFWYSRRTLTRSRHYGDDLKPLVDSMLEHILV